MAPFIKKQVMKNFKIYLASLIILLQFQGACTSQKGPVTIGSLLTEMTDREEMARFPDPGYTCREFSSYNRTSVNPGDYTWFANLDNNYFIRTENNNGRREFVLFDAEGPGAVVRFWTTFNRYDKKGVLRFYFDNEETPRLEGEPMELISGGRLAGAPLSFSVSEDTDYERRGHNLYLPIPYSQHLKITYETGGITEARTGVNETNREGEMFYYQINYRTYDSDVAVESFDLPLLNKYNKKISYTREKLSVRDRGLKGVKLHNTSLDCVLAPGESNIVILQGQEAIRQIGFKVEAGDIQQALRSTVLKISFDGSQTVWAPAGDFFGTGYKISAASTWYQEVNTDGVMKAFWVMPFSKECRIELVNYGADTVRITNGEVALSQWKWDSGSMYFGSSWHQYTRVNTGLVKNRDGQGDMFDVSFTALEGKGVYIGDGLTLFNCSPAWWGEGDEKIFVDNEKFPSHFGTGTEDYYGYAWCRPETFTHPFISQPDGSGNLDVGYTVDLRYRTLDAIPFNSSLRFDMELWHWGYTIMNYAPVTYWYMLPGGKCEIQPDINGAKETVVTRREQIFPPVINEHNMVEGEDLVIENTTGSGSVRIRPLPVPGKPNWTSAVMSWTNAVEGDEATFRFISPDNGNYNISVRLVAPGKTVMPDFYLNGGRLEISGGGLSTGAKGTTVTLKNASVKKGDNILTLRLTRDPGPANMTLGIDCITFSKK
jgi:hypothetical protein